MDYFSYFDEEYYENGESKGTAYFGYKANVLKSETFRSIAELLFDYFQPRNVLEIGCGIGQIGYHLEKLGVDYFGLEVSDYCLINKVCKNVIKADSVMLPFPDNHFDLVFGCHSLEHFSNELLNHSLEEHVRITKKYYGHFLPMVGTKPYFNIDGLRKDPTHFQLHSKEQWLDRILSVDDMAHIDINLPIDDIGLYYSQIWFAKAGFFPSPDVQLRNYMKLVDNFFQKVEGLKAAALENQKAYLQLVFSDAGKRGTIIKSEKWVDTVIDESNIAKCVSKIVFGTCPPKTVPLVIRVLS